MDRPSRSTWALRRLTLCIAVVFAVVGIAACGDDDDDSGGGAQSGGKPTTVRLTTNPFAGSAAAFVARDQGFLEEENLELKPDFLRFTPDAVAAVVGGNADFAIISTITIMAAANKNVPIEIVAPGYFINPEEQGYFVKEDSDIKSPADFAGKKIGTGGKGNINELAVTAIAAEAGVEPSELELVELPLPDMASAVRNGRVDVGPMVEPFITQATDGMREVIDNPYEVYGDPDQILVYYITSKEFAKENPDVVAGFKRAILKAQEYATENPDSVRKAVGSYTEVDPATLGKMALPKFGTDMARDKIEQQAKTAVKYGYIDELPDFDKVFPPE
jgi:NitT/TauT family transport system substrate-binding protein